MQLAAIHILRHDLGLAEATYRAVLAECGVHSSRELSDSGRKKVYGKLRRLGTAHHRVSRYIWVLIGELKGHLPAADRGGAYFCGFIRRACGREIADLTQLDLLTPFEAHKVVEALKQRLTYETDRPSASSARWGMLARRYNVSPFFMMWLF